MSPPSAQGLWGGQRQPSVILAESSATFLDRATLFGLVLLAPASSTLDARDCDPHRRLHSRKLRLSRSARARASAGRCLEGFLFGPPRRRRRDATLSACTGSRLSRLYAYSKNSDCSRPAMMRRLKHRPTPTPPSKASGACPHRRRPGASGNAATVRCGRRCRARYREPRAAARCRWRKAGSSRPW